MASSRLTATALSARYPQLTPAWARARNWRAHPAWMRSPSWSPRAADASRSRPPSCPLRRQGWPCPARPLQTHDLRQHRQHTARTPDAGMVSTHTGSFPTPRLSSQEAAMFTALHRQSALPRTAARNAGAGRPAAPRAPAPRARRGPPARSAGRRADDPPAQAHPPSGAPLMNHTAAASTYPSWADPS